MKKKFEEIRNILLERFNIKFLILIALIVILMTTLAVFLLLKVEKKEAPEVNYNNFEIGREQVESIGSVVGERFWSSMEVTVEGTTETAVYTYTGLTSGSEDVKKYAEYLKDTCGFVPMMKFDPSNPAGYLSYGKASIDPGYILKIDIDYTNEDYKIYTNKSESTDMPASDPNKEETVSREDTLQYLKSYDFKILGLAKEFDSYITIYDVGRTVINNSYCHGINVYEKSADGKSNLAVGKFFVPVDQSSIYKYDVLTDSFVQIKRKAKKTPPPPEKTAEETPEEPAKIDTSNMTKEEIKALKDEEKAKKKADKEKEKIDAAAAKELDKANKAAQKEQEKKAAASKKASDNAIKAAEKAAKAEEKAAKAKEEAEKEKAKAEAVASKVPQTEAP